MKNSEKGATSLDDVMNSFNMNLITTTAGVAGLITALKSLISGLKGVINNYAQFEGMQKSLETFFQSADKGKAKFEELRKLSNETTFGVDELANAFTQLANVGVDVDAINDRLTMLGNIAGGDKNKFADLVSIYSKIQSLGKAGSEQLQMLAMRGVPIYESLKQIGVQGTATGEQITTVLQNMTKEGGQFYNAMNNINETISGKEGFVADYWKELTVNFAEASGVAELYKDILDKVNSVVKLISDSLLKVNENPVLQALLRGTLTASLTLLVSVIGVSLFSALKVVGSQLTAMISKLAILKALSGPAGWASLAVAGAIGVSVGLTSLIKATDEAKQENEEMDKTIIQLTKSGENYKQVVNGVVKEYASLNDVYNQLKDSGNSTSFIDNVAKKLVDLEVSANNARKSYEEYLDAVKSAVTMGDYGAGKKSFKEATKYKEQLKSIEEQKEYYENMLQTQIAFKTNAEVLQKAEENRKKAIKEQNESLEEQLKTVEKIYKKTTAGQLEELTKQINEYKDVLQWGGRWELKETPKQAQYGGAPAQTYQLTTLNDEQKKFFQKALEEVEASKKKIEDELKLKSLLEAEGGWRGVLQDVLGTSDDDVRAGKLDNGGKAIEDYLGQLQSKLDLTTKTNEMLGVNKKVGTKAVVESKIEEVMRVYNALMSSGKFGVQENGELDNTTKSIKASLETLKQAFFNAGGTVEQFDELLGNLSVDLEEPQTVKGIFKNAKDNLISGTDVGHFASTFAQNQALDMPPEVNVLMSLLEVVAKDFVDIVGGMEHVQELLNPLKQALQTLAPLLRIIVNCFRLLQLPLTMFWKGLETVIDFLFSGIDDAFNNWLNDITGFEEESENLEDNLKAINEEYKTLLSAMKEQEEYYFEQKKLINASSYASDVYKVNDMILTPQGNFSTAPDDYIIATKNPNSLGGGGNVKMFVNIQNKMSESANIQVQQNNNELAIIISKKVADDYVNGRNGWGTAYQLKQSKIAGRNVQ